MSLSIEQFNPTVAELNSLAASSKELTVTDFTDKNQLEAVKTKRLEMVKIRVAIEKTGKAMRDDAIKFQREVIAKEKELVAIIEPEEIRLKALEEEAKNYLVKQERLRKQPERLERLTASGEWNPEPGAEENILTLDDVQFEAYLNQLIAVHTQKEQAKKEEEQAAKQAELDKRQAELDAKQAIIDAKENEAKQKELDAKAEEKRLADVEAARLAGEEKAKADFAKVEQEEKEKLAKLEKTKKFKEFLAKHSYTEKNKHNFKIYETETSYTLYKRVGEFQK